VQAEAQSTSTTTKPRPVRTAEARAASAKLIGTSSLCVGRSDTPTTRAVYGFVRIGVSPKCMNFVVTSGGKRLLRGVGRPIHPSAGK
jgi:hypothetical protein